LLHERGAAEGAGGGARVSDATDRLLAYAKGVFRDGVCAALHPVTRDRIIALVIRSHGIEHNARRAVVPALCDHPMRIPLQGKVAASELGRDVAQLGAELSGALGVLGPLDASAPEHGHWPVAYMDSYGFTIAAGTSEIQRNILGERVLGLEKSK
jgi:alkylation response protein AidB-like acyl-CoA dehydrogenase